MDDKEFAEWLKNEKLPVKSRNPSPTKGDESTSTNYSKFARLIANGLKDDKRGLFPDLGFKGFVVAIIVGGLILGVISVLGYHPNENHSDNSLVVPVVIFFFASICAWVAYYLIWSVLPPKWIGAIHGLNNILTSDQKERLEKLRKNFNIPPEMFAATVLSAPEIGTLIVKQRYAQYKSLGNMSDQQICYQMLVEEFLSDPDNRDGKAEVERKCREFSQAINNLNLP